MKILIATTNGGKLAEFKALLADSSIEFASLEDFDLDEIEETGSTFAENSELKARGYARQTGLITLADDSGLEVDALGGAPGVFSARYAGEGANAQANNNKLIEALKDVEPDTRTAQYVCAVSLALPNGKILYTAFGKCRGIIHNVPKGLNGFGYDPLFAPDGFELSFGELDDKTKNRISHRSIAIRKIRDFFSKNKGSRLDQFEIRL